MNDYILEGKAVEVLESVLVHPTHADGFVDSGDLVYVTGTTLVGVAMDSAAAATDLVRVWVTGVVSAYSAAVTATAQSAIAVGDKLYLPAADVFAIGTLTSDATAPTTADTVTIGTTVYTFRTALSVGPTIPYEVLIGASAAAALDNLKSAINATAGGGTTYSTGTLAHPTVTAETNTNTTQVVQAKAAGGVASLIVTTEASTHLSWGATYLQGGTLIGEPNKNTGLTVFGLALTAVAAATGRAKIPIKIKKTM